MSVSSDDFIRVAVNQIFRRVADDRGLPLDKLQSAPGARGRRSIQIARCEVAWLASKLVDATFHELGKAMSRDHSTVMHAIKRIDALREADPDLAERLNGLLDALTAPIGRLETAERERVAAWNHAVAIVTNLTPGLVEAVASEPETAIPALQAIAGVESEPA